MTLTPTRRHTRTCEFGFPLPPLSPFPISADCIAVYAAHTLEGSTEPIAASRPLDFNLYPGGFMAPAFQQRMVHGIAGPAGPRAAPQSLFEYRQECRYESVG